MPLRARKQRARPAAHRAARAPSWCAGAILSLGPLPVRPRKARSTGAQRAHAPRLNEPHLPLIHKLGSDLSKEVYERETRAPQLPSAANTRSPPLRSPLSALRSGERFARPPRAPRSAAPLSSRRATSRQLPAPSRGPLFLTRLRAVRRAAYAVSGRACPRAPPPLPIPRPSLPPPLTVELRARAALRRLDGVLRRVSGMV
jgi:hypothetical protein